MKKRAIIFFVLSMTAAILLILSLNNFFTSRTLLTGHQLSQLTVSAAVSLTSALQEIKQVYAGGKPNFAVIYNFGASGSLQQQIEQGAPVDIFLSAGVKQMDNLQQKGLLIPETRKNLLTNRLVLIRPKNSIYLTDFKDLTRRDIKRIAIGEPRSVPAGQYAQEVLTNLRIFDQLKSKLVFANNVRQVLTYVETGDVDAGIVYLTDARESNLVSVVAIAAEALHSPIVYPLAILKSSKNVDSSREFVQFISSNAGKVIFEKYGFTVAK